MAVSAFDLFKIGIGPSSSHTVGPMRAARQFALRLEHHGLLDRAARVRSELYGSLGATGRGHGTDKAILLGLEGEQPDAVDVDAIPDRLAAIRSGGRLRLLGRREVAFDEPEDLVFSQRASPDGETPFHTNNLRFTALDETGTILLQARYYSVGGGFVVSGELAAAGDAPHGGIPAVDELPHPYRSADELLEIAAAEGTTIAGIVRRNERHWRSDAEIDAGLLRIWAILTTPRAIGIVYDIGQSRAIEVGALPGLNGALAFGVSNAGHVVGSSMLNQGSGMPFIWTIKVEWLPFRSPQARAKGPPGR